MLKGKVIISASAMVTSLGEGVERNFSALLRGEVGVRRIVNPRVSQSPVTAGIIPDSVYDALYERYDRQRTLTLTEIIAVHCISSVLGNRGADGIGLVIASAKGNISLLEGHSAEWAEFHGETCDVAGGLARHPDSTGLPENLPGADSALLLGHMARRIATEFGINADDTFVVSNACISGITAVAVARRLILSGRYKEMVVVGVDTQNRFITSGFASFKSLSDDVCRPYDESRCGLNLGEACGAMLLTTEGEGVCISGAALTDDANHISGPSRTGDGLYFAMRKALSEAGADNVDVLQMHGTATAYNDEMESKACSLAGLQNVPVQSLKPYFGHTMGASGVIETIIAAEELRNQILAGTPGFETLGVPMPLNISRSNVELPSGKPLRALKTASGFGGTNAALILEYAPQDALSCESPENVPGAMSDETGFCAESRISEDKVNADVLRTVLVESSRILLNDKEVYSLDSVDFQDFIRSAFKTVCAPNMKFYKMDSLSKLGYVASEVLLDGIEYGEEDCGLILSGVYGSLDTDIRHQQIIDTETDASASPAVFVYTLPNVVEGEISIRHHIKGENTWFWSDDRTLSDVREYAVLSMSAQDMKYCIVGHIDFLNGRYFAKFELLVRR